MTVKVDIAEKGSGKAMTAEAEQNTALPERKVWIGKPPML